MVALPLGKLAILAVKQIAKPISKGLKRVALNSKIIRNYFIMPVAQGVNWVDVKAKTTLMGAKQAKVYRLNENVAVEYGAEFISETFLYVFGAVIVLYEYSRNVAKEERKEEKIKEETERMKYEIEKLSSESVETTFVMEEQAAEIRSLHRQLSHLHSLLGKISGSNS